MVRMAVVGLVLFAGASLLWLGSEFYEGRTRASLHVGNALAPAVLGTALYPWGGWTAAAGVLAAFGLWWWGAAVLARRPGPER